jgi:hypothetical protein
MDSGRVKMLKWNQAGLPRKKEASVCSAGTGSSISGEVRCPDKTWTRGPRDARERRRSCTHADYDRNHAGRRLANLQKARSSF